MKPFWMIMIVAVVALPGSVRAEGSPIEQVGKVAEQFKDLAEQADSLRELEEAFDGLSEDDEDLDVPPDGSPDLPVSCSSEECGKCYEEAQDALNAQLFRLEKLRHIYEKTKKVVDKAVAFGDATSGIHGVVALAWHAEKKDIEDSIKGLEAAYDAKFPEIMEELKVALDGIGDCEEEFFDNPDWFNRFGFIYIQFIADKYKRE